MVEELPEGIKKAVIDAILKGNNNNQIAEAFGISWHSVQSIRQKMVEDGNVEKRKEKQEIQIDTKTSAEIFSLFDNHKTPIDAVKMGYDINVVNRLWKQYFSFKGVDPAKVKDMLCLQQEIKNIEYALLHIMANFKWMASPSRRISGEDIVWCPKCHQKSHFVLNKEGEFVCARCRKKPF
ncbi:MAG: hypothetical protein DRN17_04520, partial [Thermoplasmata archaeon]